MKLKFTLAIALYHYNNVKIIVGQGKHDETKKVLIRNTE